MRTQFRKRFHSDTPCCRMAGKAGCSYDRQNSIDPTSRSEILLCNLIGNIIRKEGVGSLKSAVCGLQSSKWPLVQDFPWCCGCVARLFSKWIFSIRGFTPETNSYPVFYCCCHQKNGSFLGLFADEIGCDLKCTILTYTKA